MKTTNGLTKRATVIVACVSLMLLNFATWTAFAAGETLQATEAVWGNPIGIQKLDNGIEKRFYKYENTADLGFRYFVYKDGKVLDDGLVHSVPIEVKKAEKKGLPVSELSKSYYRNHPTTAEDVDRTWGKPVAVRPLEDGSEERYYKYQNTMDLGFRNFLIKDGKVIASGNSIVTGVPETKAELTGVPVIFVKETGTENVEDVERVWGKPVGVRNLANGTQERYYKFENTMDIGKMFLFKDGKAVGSNIAKYF